jgi:hypothetical protein
MSSLAAHDRQGRRDREMNETGTRTETTFEILIRADAESPWDRATRSYGNADAAIVAADRYQANGNETRVQKVTTTWETVA